LIRRVLHDGLNGRGRGRQRVQITRRGGSSEQKSGRSLGSCHIAQCSPKETACEFPKECGTKRKALSIDGRSARFLCAVSILLHRHSPFCEAVQAATRDWIVAARDARAHYMFLLGGDRRPSLGIAEGCNARSI
jgi:hypothetical protein